MKSAIIAAMLLCTAACAQEAKTPAKIRPNEARTHVGTEKIVTGQIAEVNFAEKLVRLNFEKPFPNQPFTAVIFVANTNVFPHLDTLKDKTVEVRGKISEYRGRPQIVLTSTNQLRIVPTAPATRSSENKK